MANETPVAEATPTAEVAPNEVSAAFTSALSQIGDYKYLQEREASTKTAETKPEPAADKVETKSESETEAAEVSETSTETPETTEEDTVEEPPPPTDPKAQAKWVELKKELKALKAEKEAFSQREEQIRQEAIKEVQEKLEQIQKDHDALKQEREAIDKELYLSRVEATREYKQAVTEPLEKTFTQVETLAAQYKIDANSLVDALYKDVSGDPTALDELISEIPERHRNKIYTLSENLLQIENRRADLKENAKQAYQTSLEKEKVEREQFTTKIRETREKELNELTTKFSERFKTLLGEDTKIDYDAVRRDAIDMESWDESTKMYGALAAVTLPEVLKTLERIAGEAKKLKAENAKLRGGTPKTQSGHSPSSPADIQPKKDYSRMSWDDMAKESASRLFSGVAA